MPLLPGYNNIKKNVEELVTGKMSGPRRKAVNTLAKRWGISKEEARFRQALIIAKETAK